MLRSTDIVHTKFDENELRALTKSRIKSFKTACYKAMGTRFGGWCCDDKCEWVERERDTPEYAMAKANMDLINKVYSEMS
ncbi:hypothetical protein [Aeromonas phage Riv-10]|uniref:Uncharacterized protein n=1 Tax=Aeromonas phage vB_AehM_DM2 TaxID=2973716 RepID=A0AA95C480_9CAUD|nr:hypothetical protein [Aeromonas phage L9-6]APU02175.1 hypothetical protein [Aeromonas phage Riv-10]UYD59673.1 hypothetical protein JNMOADIG_00153 [Aeromonas phage avDM5]UYD60353.1 hypothetical protein NPHMPGLK_00009 [Aeromonas phage avDM2]UYD60811.1 hypothetical protein NHNEHLNL_00224 [Aeromonas phage avDM2]